MPRNRLATKAQRTRIEHMLASGLIDREEAQDFITKPRLPQEMRRIVVPRFVSSAELIAAAEKKIRPLKLDPEFAKWNFGSGDGKTYEVVTWAHPHQLIVTREMLREHLRAFGAKGSVPLFVAWISKYIPIGLYSTIPQDNVYYSRGGEYCDPFFEYGDGVCNLRLTDPTAGSTFSGPWIFVGFREVE